MRKVCGISVSGNEMSAFKSLEAEKLGAQPVWFLLLNLARLRIYYLCKM
jgi:hypothetical protein